MVLVHHEPHIAGEAVRYDVPKREVRICASDGCGTHLRRGHGPYCEQCEREMTVDVCPVCQGEFEQKATGRRRVYCSDKCKAKAKAPSPPAAQAPALPPEQPAEPATPVPPPEHQESPAAGIVEELARLHCRVPVSVVVDFDIDELAEAVMERIAAKMVSK